MVVVGLGEGHGEGWIDRSRALWGTGLRSPSTTSPAFISEVEKALRSMFSGLERPEEEDEDEDEEVEEVEEVEEDFVQARWWAGGSSVAKETFEIKRETHFTVLNYSTIQGFSVSWLKLQNFLESSKTETSWKPPWMCKTTFYYSDGAIECIKFIPMSNKLH